MRIRTGSNHVPSAIAFATDFGIDDVQSRLTGEVLEVLHIEIRSSPIQQFGVKSSTQNRAMGIPGPGMLGPIRGQGKSRNWGV
jgi:hypothetical protein